MGLEELSMPTRLAVVVMAASLGVLCAIAVINRLQNGRNKRTASSVPTPVQATESIKSVTLEDVNEPELSDSEFFEQEIQPLRVQNHVLDELAEISRISDVLSKSATTPDVRQYSRKILSAAENARRLIQNETMLENPIAFAPSFRPLSVNFPVFVSTLAKKWAYILRSEDVEFTCHFDKNIPESLYVDPTILTRILDTLLSNSQALTQKGRIHLHITGKEKLHHNWDLNIIVADTGRGIRKAFKDTLKADKDDLSPGNKEEINLVAVRDLTREINGDMVLKSVEERGTEVSIKLKVRAAASVESSTPADQTGLLQGKRVLIIEDDISSQEVLKTFLSPEGCEIDTILDGDKALKTLEANNYDLVLMDVRMDGMDGIKTTQAIRNSDRAFKSIPVIAITADVDPDTNAKCMMAGANLFLNKPIGAKALFNGIQFVMDSADPKKTAAE